MASLNNFLFELESLAVESLNPNRVAEYLKEIKGKDTLAMYQSVFQYILIVRSKALLMVTSYYAFKKDTSRVANEFECFNRDFHEYNNTIKNHLGPNFEYTAFLRPNFEVSACNTSPGDMNMPKTNKDHSNESIDERIWHSVEPSGYSSK